MIKLLGCPFCGEDPYYGGNEHGGRYTIECDEGGNHLCSAHADNEQDAIKLWNTRSTSSQEPETYVELTDIVVYPTGVQLNKATVIRAKMKIIS